MIKFSISSYEYGLETYTCFEVEESIKHVKIILDLSVAKSNYKLSTVKFVLLLSIFLTSPL